MNGNHDSYDGTNLDPSRDEMDFEQIKLTLGILQLDPADRAVIRVAGKPIVNVIKTIVY